MQYVGLLAPIAFVFALSALSQVGALKKEVDELRAQIAHLSNTSSQL